jgi:predicted phosphodiesterase
VDIAMKRAYLIWIVWGLASTLWAAAALPTPDLDGTRRPPVERRSEDFLFVFAVIADSHIKSTFFDDHRYLKAMSIAGDLLANCVDDINSHVPPVAFVLHLGDITEQGKVTEFRKAKAILEKLRCPLYPVLGNHDNFMSDYKWGWKDYAERDTTFYTFDHFGFHFIVIDCTPNPYIPANIECDSSMRDWVAAHLAAHPDRPAFILSHYNMWERGWNALFDTVGHYIEYNGMPELRQVLEQAGNVVAVINGHVHANRVETHGGIYYIDVGATLVGRPSIRYFYVYPDRVEVTYEYISDVALLEQVTGICPRCCCCFDPLEVCDFIDGEESDKEFTMPVAVPVAVGKNVQYQGPPFVLRVTDHGNRRIEAAVSSGILGALEISMYDVMGRKIGTCHLRKDRPVTTIDLTSNLPAIEGLPQGVYFIQMKHGTQWRTAKLVLAPGRTP